MRKFLFFSFLLLMTSGLVMASGAYDLREVTPQVQSALDARRSRFDELKTLKTQGVVGENNRGYVEVVGEGSQAKALVDAENVNRALIYQAIVEQNNLGKDALATVEGVFAGVQREKASPGEKIQDVSGTWVTK